MEQNEIFGRSTRRRRRDRAQRVYAEHDFLRAAMIDGLLDRLSIVTRDFDRVLDLGCFDGALSIPGARHIARLDAGAAFARQAGGVQADEDRLPFADASFDCIVSAGVLDTVNDLPGALTLARRALAPDGLFLGAFLGGNTLDTLRRLMIAAEGDRPAARFHPRIDVRSAGDLMSRAGFALPVADVETVTVRYRDPFRLMADLRGMAAGNLLPEARALRRDTIARLLERFAARRDAEGRVAERFDIVFVTGWAPSPDQPKPARRGSGRQSLADVLKTPD